MSAVTAKRALNNARDSMVAAYLAVTSLPHSQPRAGLIDGLLDLQRGLQNLLVYFDAVYQPDMDETQDAVAVEDEP